MTLTQKLRSFFKPKDGIHNTKQQNKQQNQVKDR